MEDSMKKLSVFLIAIILIVAGAAYTQRAQNSTPDKMPIRSIPAMETERLAREGTPARENTGRLTAEMLQQDRTATASRSTIFVMENVKAANVNLPITGERARIGIFSATDGNLDVQLADPTGGDIPLKPHARNLNEPDAFSKVTVGRGSATDGVLLITERPQMAPGLYTMNVRQAKSAVDIIVNDEGGPELNVWFADNGRDASTGTTIYAKLVDGTAKISGAQLNARVRGAKGKGIQFSETEPGIYSATLDTSKLSGITTFIVEAKGHTTGGLQVLRHGSIELISGQANAKLIGVVKEEVNATDLTVDVKIKVSATGRYYLRGNLLGAHDEPIAWAQDAQELTAGEHTLTLHFAREVINQSGLSGGFKLSDLELMNTTEMPGIKAAEKINDFFLKSSL